MREAQVAAAGVDVHRRAEGVQRHRRALGVPARPAGAPRALPGRLVPVRRLPHRHVERVVLARVVRVVTVFRGQPQRRRAVQSCPPGGGGAAEVLLAVPPVGRIAGQQPGGQRDHLPDVGMRPGLQGGLPHAERGHVLVEVELLDDGELVVGGTRPPRGGQQDIVDVGHVAAHDHLGASRVQHTGQRVDPHERRSMAQMGDVVRGDTARVHPGPADQRQRRPAYRRHLRQASSQHLVHRQPLGWFHVASYLQVTHG